MVQSILAAKNIKEGRLGACFTAWLKILDMFLFILPGIICVVLFPNLSNPDEAYMTMVRELLPHGMIGLIMTILMAALISTVASALNSLSTVFTLDIYQKRFRPHTTVAETVRIGRIVTLVGSVLSIFLALGISRLDGLSLFSLCQAILGFLAPPISVVFMVGVLWRGATAKAANIILTGGTVISLGIGLCYLLHWPSQEAWPHFLFLSFLIFAGLCLLMVILSLLTQKNSKPCEIKTLIETYRENGRVGVGVWGLWMALIMVMVGLYLFFN